MRARRPGDMFERLVVLRRCYALRSDYDRRVVLSVPAAIDYGEWRMRLARISEFRQPPWHAHRT